MPKAALFSVHFSARCSDFINALMPCMSSSFTSCLSALVDRMSPRGGRTCVCFQQHHRRRGRSVTTLLQAILLRRRMLPLRVVWGGGIALM